MGEQALQHGLGPALLAGGIAATAFGQPEVGMPMMGAGGGRTIGDVAGGQQGRAMGTALGGLAGGGAEMIPGATGAAQGAAANTGSKLFGGMPMTSGMQQVAQQNPSLAGTDLTGARVAGTMPNAPTNSQISSALNPVILRMLMGNP